MKKDWLHNQYITQNKSIPQIEVEFNIPRSTIHYNLKKYEIPTRSISESTKIAMNRPEVKKKQIEGLNTPEVKRKRKEYNQRPEVRKARSEIMKARAISNENHPHWKGDNVGYKALHKWIKKEKPKPKLCELCGEPEYYKSFGKFQLSNKTGKLIRDTNNFQWVHQVCHSKYDGFNGIIHEGSLYPRNRP